jgi:hypothetical protein
MAAFTGRVHPNPQSTILNPMTAPYIIRDPLGEWHPFDLPTQGDAWGSMLILWLFEGESLSAADLLAAIRSAIKTSGEWWTLTASYRNIRDLPSIHGSGMDQARKGDRFEIVERRADAGTLGKEWGKILRAVYADKNHPSGEETTRLRGRWIWLG